MRTNCQTALEVKEIGDVKIDIPSNFEEMTEVHPKCIQWLVRETAASENLCGTPYNKGAVICRYTKEESDLCENWKTKNCHFWMKQDNYENVQPNNGICTDVVDLEMNKGCATNDGSVRILESPVLSSSYEEYNKVIVKKD